MHFCKLPCLTLGPAEQCLLGRFFQALSVPRGWSPGECEWKAWWEVREQLPALGVGDELVGMAFWLGGQRKQANTQAFLLPNCESYAGNHNNN